MAKVISPAELATHNTEQSCWVAVQGRVFDVTSFLGSHPGGKKVLLREAGTDATTKFLQFHKLDVLAQYQKLCVGTLGGRADAAPTSAGVTAPSPARTAASPRSSAQSPSTSSFGELIPHGDPSWYQDWHSPYFNDSHRRFRTAVRAFVEKEVMPFTHEWDEKKAVPRELYTKAYAAGWLPAVVGPPWPTALVGNNIAGGVTPQEAFAEFDSFHEYILIDEVARCGSAGVLGGLFIGLNIGLPPVMQHATPQVNARVSASCLKGEKVICLAITEPGAGSDVAALSCEAKKTPDGKYYIVNGAKKWITNGVFADFFTVAVRTGGAGMGGISLLVLEREMAGLKTRQMECMGGWGSGTAYITFEDVRVPVENLLGKENEGFKYIMDNFNHERWSICVQVSRLSRVCFEEAFKYAHKRKTFGQRLVDHPVIRNKLAQMAARIEALQAWTDHLTYQLTKMNKRESNDRLGGPIALCKAQGTQTFEFCAREAAQIFGGLAYTRGGQGEKVERLYREVRGYAIPGGSEEIMLDLGIRQAMRKMPAKL